MHINRLIKIVAAFAICAIAMVPVYLGPRNFQFQMAMYVVLSALMIYIFYKLIRELLNKDSNHLPEYQYDEFGIVDIVISPARVTFLCFIMILLSAAVMTTIIYPAFLDATSQSNTAYIFLILLLILFGYVCWKGVELFLRRNHVIQLRLTRTSIQYLPVDVKGSGRGRGFSILTMYFRKNLTELEYNQIKNIELERNVWNGDRIRITRKSGQVIILPFLADNQNQLHAVFFALSRRWETRDGKIIS